MILLCSKRVMLIIIVVNALLIYSIWDTLIHPPKHAQPGEEQRALSDPSSPLEMAKPNKPRDRIQSANKHIRKSVTIIFRDFYHFDTDLRASIDSVLSLIPNIEIIVIYEGEPYPPLDYMSNYTTKNNVHFVNIEFDVQRTAKSMSPMHLVKTRFTLLMPDSVRLGGRSIIQKMLREIEKDDTTAAGGIVVGGPPTSAHGPNEKFGSNSSSNKREAPSSSTEKRHQKKMLVIPFSSNIRGFTSCCRVYMDFANWTLEYSVRNGTENCDMYLQKHAILMETAILKDLPSPFAAPFPEMLYIQAKAANIRKLYLHTNLQDGKRLFSAFHNKQRKKEIRRHQFRSMYKLLQIKKVIRKVPVKPNTKSEKPRKYLTGGDPAIKLMPVIPANTSLQLITTIEYYGCDKNTKSCIGPVFGNKPFYMHLRKHTPPCCLEKLKSVVQHVLDELENVGIRYWLDNQALRSALDTGALHMDAYEVDISFNVDDLERSDILKKCQTRPIVNAAGFYWMKATDGHYFRVLYSKMNQIGVNLLPFQLHNDRMLPNGFYGWKAKEFSSDYVHPMSNVVLLGKNVMCPNNVKEFLDIKSAHL